LKTIAAGPKKKKNPFHPRVKPVEQKKSEKEPEESKQEEKTQDSTSQPAPKEYVQLIARDNLIFIL
jgi:hypothetical protein